MNDRALSLGGFNRLFADEEAARAWFEGARWPDGPVCSDCGSVGDAYWLKSVCRWQCKGCSKQSALTAGTPLHRTHLPLLVWAQAIYQIVASSKIEQPQQQHFQRHQRLSLLL